jgi:hypothetical protein
MFLKKLTVLPQAETKESSPIHVFIFTSAGVLHKMFLYKLTVLPQAETKESSLIHVFIFTSAGGRIVD